MAGPEPLLVAGRYALYAEIAAGGMATVHLGRLVGAAGFARVVAIKRLHPQHARNPDIVAMLLDEARLAARIQHPNVAATIDVLVEGGVVLLVFEYVAGESLGSLVRLARARGERIPLPVVSAIGVGMLHGLHAAHEARTADGVPLEIVHRDVSPQNVLVGSDGVPRVIDFGIAKANLRSSETREGELKGKLIYMPPEQLAGRDVTRASDVYAAGVVLWELLAGRRLFDQPTHAGIVGAILGGTAPRLLDEAPWVPPPVAAVIERALASDPDARWPTALAMAAALEVALPAATPPAVAAFVESVAAESLARRRAAVHAVETAPAGAGPGGRSSLHPALLTVILVLASVAVGVGLALAWLGGGDDGETGGVDGETRRDDGETSAGDEQRDPPGGGERTSSGSEGAAPSGSDVEATTGGDDAPSVVDATTGGEAPPDVGTEADLPAPSASATPGRRPPPRPPRTTSTTRPPLPACDPPWEIDAAGIRRVKRHCIGR